MMSNNDEFTDGDWTPEERELLASLPRERVPPADLKARTIDAVRRSNAGPSHSHTQPRRVLGLVAAAAAIFAAGTLVGFAAARHWTQSNGAPPPATRQAASGAEHQPLITSQVRYVVWY